MPLYCRDGEPGVFLPCQPAAPLARGEKWQPPDLERDRCQRPEVTDIECRLRVRIWHDGHWYEIAPDAQNKLTLRAVGGGQLIIKPRASNDVRLDVEGVG